jgi:hypothetical protein
MTWLTLLFWSYAIAIVHVFGLRPLWKDVVRPFLLLLAALLAHVALCIMAATPKAASIMLHMLTLRFCARVLYLVIHSSYQ